MLLTLHYFIQEAQYKPLCIRLWDPRDRERCLLQDPGASSGLALSEFQWIHSFIHSLIHSFNKNLLSTYDMSGIVLGAGDTAVKKAEKTTCSHGNYILVGIQVLIRETNAQARKISANDSCRVKIGLYGKQWPGGCFWWVVSVRHFSWALNDMREPIIWKLGRKAFRQREQHMQRPWDGNKLGVFGAQREAQYSQWRGTVTQGPHPEGFMSQRKEFYYLLSFIIFFQGVMEAVRGFWTGKWHDLFFFINWLYV